MSFNLDYDTASVTKDYFEVELFDAHPEIVSISPRVVGGKACICIGVNSNDGEPIPETLPAVNDEGKTCRVSATVFFDVLVEYVGPIKLEKNERLLDWPELDGMDRDQLLGVITEIREGLSYTEDAHDFCTCLAESLKVNVSA